MTNKRGSTVSPMLRIIFIFMVVFGSGGFETPDVKRLIEHVTDKLRVSLMVSREYGTQM